MKTKTLIQTKDGYIVFFKRDDRNILFWEVDILKIFNPIKRIQKNFLKYQKKGKDKEFRILNLLNYGCGENDYLLMSYLNIDEFMQELSAMNVLGEINFVHGKNFMNKNGNLLQSIKEFS